MSGDGIRLTWPGRTWRAEGQRSPGRRDRARVVELTSGAGAEHRLVHGDALGLCGALEGEGLAGKVDLVYVDPPYASDRDYLAEARLDGPADGRVTRSLAYEDTWSAKTGGVGGYLDMLAPRLDALTGLLAPGGTIWVHLDWRAAYLVRALLDEILGREAFVNEIVWRRAPNLGRQAASGQFGRTLDTLVVYGKRAGAKLRPPTRLEAIEPSAIRWDDQGRPFTSAPRGDYTDASIVKLEAEGRVHRSESGKVYIKYFLVKDGAGTWCRERRVDALWTDVAPLRHAAAKERTGYPTQKPRALLERIISCATPEGGLVVDAFAGSGTTGVAAHAVGRRAILGDRSPVAIAAARARMLRDGAALAIERLDGVAEPAAARVKLQVAEQMIRLVEPKEPLGWAIGTEKAGVFRCAWHSERMPGTRPIPAAREANVGAARHTAVRVWGDDGSVTTQRVKEVGA
jgi:DNA modification methylase